MKYIFVLMSLFTMTFGYSQWVAVDNTMPMISEGVEKSIAQSEDAATIIDKIDKNMSSKTRIVTSEMVIYGKRKTKTVSFKGYSEGFDKSFTEYLSPGRKQGAKVLKLDDQMWFYSPATNRTIKLSGHMLRQSVMGSDLSYKDMMEFRKLTDFYTATVDGREEIDGRACYRLLLIAKVSDVAYHKRMIWVDQERYVPLKEELFAKSDQLLKRTTFKGVKKIQGRWFPTKMNYKDMLKKGKGTDFNILEIAFDAEIPAGLFTKEALKK